MNQTAMTATEEMGTNFDKDDQSRGGRSGLKTSNAGREIAVALLTGGADRPYVFGLGTALISKGAVLDLIGSNDLDCPEFHGKPGVNFLNLRGSQRTEAHWTSKISRVMVYYAKLIRYAATAKPKVFHILWNNKFDTFDRTLLMLYYKLLGKRIVFTAHNVNAAIRDGKDSALNRLTLRIQYRLSNGIFVHTEKMKRELSDGFGVRPSRIVVIPFGLNNAVPNTPLTQADARQRLGIPDDRKIVLFFGNITPYKGIEYLVAAFQKIAAGGGNYHLILAGRPDNCEKYWAGIRESLQEDVKSGRVTLRADFVPDEDTEIYFKAADVLVLPYRHVYQSGVLFLGYSFGLPVLAADVGSMKDEILEGQTGFVFKSEDPADLAKSLERYFDSDLYKNLNTRRKAIRDHATERNSWGVVGKATMSVYAGLLQIPFSGQSVTNNVSNASLNVKAPS